MWYKDGSKKIKLNWRQGGAKTRGSDGGGANLAYIYKLINQVIPYIHNIITYCNRSGTKIGQGAPRALSRRFRALPAYGRCQGASKALQGAAGLRALARRS